jgi:amino-acid N-acetyltransferase
VVWAYPVTAEPTPHKVTFSTGERLYGAWAEDAMATPFVQGRLWETPLTVTIESVCAHSGRPMTLVVDSDMRVLDQDADATPLVFMPSVNWDNFTAPTIIDYYWRNSVFFWSEEHARDYRAGADQPNGIYLTLEQIVFSTPIVQGGLFAFEVAPVPARPSDEAGIKALLAMHELPYEDLTTAHLEHFWVLRDGPRLAGVVGLEIFGEVGLLRSLAVSDAYRGRGIGTRLTEKAEDYARSQGIADLFLLTTTAADYFARHGYVRTDQDAAPGVLQDTAEFKSLCPDSAVCMVKELGNW